MLPGKDTAWWKRMLYGLLGAGVLGSAGYLGSDMLSQGKGWTLPWGIGATPSPEAEAGGEDAPSTEE
jgi:hypothetical protein